MSKLALGTVQFGMKYGIANNSDEIKQSEISDILKLSKSKNISILDTAIMYGKSETRLGNEDISSFDIVTKIPAIKNNEKNIATWIKEQIVASLSRLNKEKLYAVLLHHPSDLSGPYGKEIFNTLLRLKEEELISKIGVSIYSPNELEEITSNYKIDLVQSPLNIFDRRLETSGWMKKLYDIGIEIHSRSTFLQGLLLMDFNNIPSVFSNWDELFQQWDKEVNRLSISKMEACIQFSSSFREVSKVIIGIDNIKHLKEILDYDFSKDIGSLKNLSCTDEKLINPSNWESL